MKNYDFFHRIGTPVYVSDSFLIVRCRSGHSLASAVTKWMKLTLD